MKHCAEAVYLIYYNEPVQLLRSIISLEADFRSFCMTDHDAGSRNRQLSLIRMQLYPEYRFAYEILGRGEIMTCNCCS